MSETALTAAPAGKITPISAAVATPGHEMVNVISRLSLEQINLMKDLYFKGCTDTEVSLAVEIINRTQLDVFARQIYFIKRKVKEKGPNDEDITREVMSPQFSIDGFRLIAQRTGAYAGQLGPFWCGDDRVWHDVWLESTPPKGARVGVLRHGFVEPLWGVATMKSYRPKYGTQFWDKMPDVMLAKVAEALALRKAFPMELSGLYTSDEMDQADDPADPRGSYVEPENRLKKLTRDAEDVTPPAPQRPRQNAQLVKRLHDARKAAGLDMAGLSAEVEKLFPGETIDWLTDEQLTAVGLQLRQLVDLRQGADQSVGGDKGIGDATAEPPEDYQGPTIPAEVTHV